MVYLLYKGLLRQSGLPKPYLVAIYSDLDRAQQFGGDNVVGKAPKIWTEVQPHPSYRAKRVWELGYESTWRGETSVMQTDVWLAEWVLR